jgi:hypothetical protein
MNIGTIRQICLFLDKLGLIKMNKNLQSNLSFTYNMKITKIGIFCNNNSLKKEKIINE